VPDEYFQKKFTFTFPRLILLGQVNIETGDRILDSSAGVQQAKLDIVGLGRLAEI
jgi:hypothetical protein